ncbi:MAG: MaoC family dehydratase [Halioglobus sp.]|nr:MaoC family dehydratase [Halioglobus sp.]
MQETARRIEMTAIPGVPRMLLKAATTRKKPRGEPEFAPLAITARGVRADAGKLAKFRDVCGFATADNLPLTYPHVMAFALHLQLMLEPEFPFSPLGAVHIGNHIRQQRPLDAGEALDFEVRLGAAQQVPKGYEVGIVTEVRVRDKIVWDERSVMLLRRPGGNTNKQKTADKGSGAETPHGGESVQWHLPADLGRRYASASGDYNPIHLYPFTARPMGFRRQIAHGMWSLSRCAAHLLADDHVEPVTVDVSFKLPIFLPATVTLVHGGKGAGEFALRDREGEKPHLTGTLALDAGIGA